MRIEFTALDDQSGERWKGLFDRLWPGYRKWYLREGGDARPTYLECREALRYYMPELCPIWERLVDLAGGGDVTARFLSLYGPPAYLTGCSQAVWPGSEPLLVRNYDYSPHAFDAIALRSKWGGQRVLGTSDCLIGLVDGINEAGLAVSLTFGGRRVVGAGFGVPIILRYILETCETARQAVKRLERLPVHMAYNVTVLDRRRKHLTAYMAPDRPVEITSAAVATNHQGRVEWAQHARATATVERERYLLGRLTLHEETAPAFIGAFLRPPLYSLAFGRGFGTLYTAALWPRRQLIEYRWPGASWKLTMTAFAEGASIVDYPGAE